MLIKLEFITEDDAQHGAYYFSDRGYEVRLMGKAVVVEDPDNSDLAVVMTTYMAYTTDIANGDFPDKETDRR